MCVCVTPPLPLPSVVPPPLRISFPPLSALPIPCPSCALPKTERNSIAYFEPITTPLPTQEDSEVTMRAREREESDGEARESEMGGGCVCVYVCVCVCVCNAERN